jgi:two-component system sensor histidine kinase UhpB
LEGLVRTWTSESGIPVSATIPPGALPVPPDVALAILGIAREALTNIGKHSGAKHAWVRLEHRADGVVVTVSDDGGGYPPDRAPGHGQRIMRERADSAGLGLEIESKVGIGTEVRVRYASR